MFVWSHDAVPNFFFSLLSVSLLTAQPCPALQLSPAMSPLALETHRDLAVSKLVLEKEPMSGFP